VTPPPADRRSIVDLFAFLSLASMRNRLLRQTRRLRQPRYAIALLLGATYIWYFLFRRPSGPPPLAFLTEGTFERWAALGLFVMFMRWWLFGKDRSALAFTPAEVQFLFTAPISRRQLIQYKLLRSQLAILVSSLIWVFLLRGGGLTLSPLLRALSLWGLFSFFTLHRLGATLVRTAAMEHGRAGVRRNIPALLVFGGIAGGLAWSAIDVVPALRMASGPPDALRAIDAALREPLASALLSPFRLLLAPTFATSTAEWATTFAAVLALLVAHYFWVIHSEAAFEDAAVEASAQRAKAIEAFRARRMGAPKPAKVGKRQWLPLSPTGVPAVAIVWKNLLAISRTSSSPLITVVVIMLLNVAVVAFGTGRGLAATLGLFAGIFAAVSIIAGSRFVRNDLRQDLLNVRLLRTYPVTGSALVAAEVASATIVLTVIQLSLLVLCHVAFISAPDARIGTGLRTLLLLAAPLVLLVVNAATVTIQNAAALMFPAWVHLGLERTTGIEALGQNLLTTLASLVVFALALIPPAIAGFVTSIGVQAVWPDAQVAALVAGGMLGLGALAVEIGVAIMMLGELFERGEMPTAAA
jgi:hypothetical protein